MVIRKFLKKYGWLYLPGIFFLAVNSRVQNLAPAALGRAVDLLSETPPIRERVLEQALAVVLIALGVFATRFIWRMFIIRNARIMECFLREELFIKLQSLPPKFYRNHQAGELMAYAINDVGAVRMTFGPVLAQGLNGILTGVLSIWAMTRAVDTRLTLLALAPVVIAVISIILVGRAVQVRFKAVQTLFSKLSGFVNESIMGAKVVKTFAREAEWEEEFDTISEDMKEANIRLTDVSAWLNPITAVTFGLSYALSLMIGGHMVMRGELSLGDLVAFLGYLLLIQNPVVALGRIVNMLQRGLASYKRLRVIFSEEGTSEFEKEDYPEKIRGKIEARNLTFTYPGKQEPALQNLSFVLEAGQTLGIAGTTGGGKSTLLSLLLKHYEAPKETLFIDDMPVERIPARAIRGVSGFVPQDGFLFSETVLNNIAFYEPGASLETVREAAKLSGIHEDIEALPLGYETEVGERGARLSGGQKQRIALARALIRRPQLLLLDDTLSAVDNLTEQEISKNLRTVMKGRTSVVVSHRLSALMHADLILYLDGGRVIERGTHESLMALGGAYAEVFRKQSEEAERHDS